MSECEKQLVEFSGHTDKPVPIAFRACKPKPRAKKRGPKGRGKGRSK